MATEIKAWSAKNGKLFVKQEDAVTEDLYIDVMKAVQERVDMHEFPFSKEDVKQIAELLVMTDLVAEVRHIAGDQLG